MNAWNVRDERKATEDLSTPGAVATSAQALQRRITVVEDHKILDARQICWLSEECGGPAPVSLDLMRYTTQFLLSAMAASQFPAADVPEIAFLGRSNVGKSSLLNELVGEKAAKVSSTPGRTRAINFFALLDQSQRRKLVFADLPGYGYAKISKSISAGWAEFIDPYLAIRSTLKLCVCLVDSNVPAQRNDSQLFDWLRAAGREFVVVATKIDRLSGNERTRNLLALKKGLELDEVLPVSAKTGYGIKELWARIEAAGGR